MSSKSSGSSESSYYTVHTGDSFNPSETSIADLASSSDGSSVLDDSFNSSCGSSSSSGSGWLDSSTGSSSSSELTFNDSTANSSDRRIHNKKMRKLRLNRGETDSEVSSVSVGDHTLVLKKVPEDEKLHSLLRKIYRIYAPHKKQDISKIVSHFIGRERDLLEAVGMKYGFDVRFEDEDEEEASISVPIDGEVSHCSTKLSDYYSEIESVGDSMQKSASGYYEEMTKKGVKIQRTIVYPTLTLTIAIECTRKMQCYILAKKRVNGVWYEVGRTNTLHCTPGLNEPFNKSFEVMYHVGIDNSQSLLLEIMDGDHLFCGSGYYFGCVQMDVSDLQQSPYRVCPVSRADRVDISRKELCALHVMTELDTAGQTLTPKTKNPLKIAFYRQRPPTIEDFRNAFPSFTDTFGTYLVNVSTHGIASEHTIDPSIITDNTRMYVKFLLNHPDYSDHETDPDALECLWESSKAMDTGSGKGKHKFKVFCPVTKIEHILLAGSRDIDNHGDKNKRLLIHLYAEGLNTKDSRTGPRLLSYAEIPVSDLISVALETAVGNDEGDVEERMLSKRTRSKAIKLNFRQVENLASKKFNEAKEEKIAEKNAMRDSGHIQRMSMQVTKLTNALGGDNIGIREDYDSMEEELQMVSKRPLDEHEISEIKREESLKNIQKDNTFNSKKYRMGQRRDAGIYGSITLRIARVEVEVKTTSGDEVYEMKLKKKFRPALKKWIKDNGVNFQVACDAQNALTMRTTQDAEFILEEGNDSALQCAMIVDMNTSCTQHVQFKIDQDCAWRGTDATAPGCNQSYVKDAMKLVCRQLRKFSKSSPFRVFAGGGVNPPGRDHPSRNYSRSQAFPLCQEVLLSREEVRSNARMVNLPLCGYTLYDPRAEIRKHLQKRADPRGDLSAAMDLDDPLGVAKRYASWKGYNYNVTQRYFDYEDISAGFYEACTLYEPSMLNRESLGKLLEELGHVRLESAAPSVTHSKGSEEIHKRQKKLMEIEQERQDWKIRYQASNVGTTQDLENSDDLFYGGIPASMQYQFVDSLDIDALESLIHKDESKKPELKKEHFTEDGDEHKEGSWFSPVKEIHDKRAVVWMLGSCPSENVLLRLGTIVEEQILHPELPLLIVVLAAETRFDLPQHNAAAVNITADPWMPLISCYEAAVLRARKKMISRRNRRRAKMHHKYVPSMLDNLLAMYLEKEAKKSATNAHKLVSSPCHNLAIARFLTWAEVVAGAFVQEEETKRIQQLTGEEDSEFASIDDDDHDVKLPKTKTLRQEMKPYLPTWSIDTVIGRVRLEDDVEASKALDLQELERGEAEMMAKDEEMKDDRNSYDGSAQAFTDDEIDKKSDISALTTPTTCENEDESRKHSGKSRVDFMSSISAKSTGVEDIGSESEKARSVSFAVAREKSKSFVKSFVNLIIGKSSKENRNVAAPSLYASERVSGFDELTDMKCRFDTECPALFEMELHNLLGNYIMIDGKLHETLQSEMKTLRPYNSEAREVLIAGASNAAQEGEGCIIM